MIAFKGGASEPSHVLLPGKAGRAVAVRRILASTICRIIDPTLVPRLRQLCDASTVMRFRPAHQSMINRRFDDRAPCRARQSLKGMLPRKPRMYLPATCKRGHESGSRSAAEFSRYFDRSPDRLGLEDVRAFQVHLVSTGISWSVADALAVLPNITLVSLPAGSPELDPTANVWQFMRQNWLPNRIFKTYDDILSLCCEACNRFTDRPRTTTSIAACDWAASGNVH